MAARQLFHTLTGADLVRGVRHCRRRAEHFHFRIKGSYTSFRNIVCDLPAYATNTHKEID